MGRLSLSLPTDSTTDWAAPEAHVGAETSGPGQLGKFAGLMETAKPDLTLAGVGVVVLDETLGPSNVGLFLADGAVLAPCPVTDSAARSRFVSPHFLSLLICLKGFIDVH
jgi:hypothetical protein